jgi:hypothetical protein
MSRLNLTALGGHGASAIGAGCGSAGRSEIETVDILNCTIFMTVFSELSGSGIGTGSTSHDGTSRIDKVRISNSKVLGGCGFQFSVIGSGPPGSDVNSLTFSGNCLIECKGMRRFGSINASSIFLSNGSLTFVTNTSVLFGMSPLNSGWFDLVIFYREATSSGVEMLSLLGNHFVHIGNLLMSSSQLDSLTFCILKTGFRRCFDNSHGSIRSFIASVAGPGDYSFPAWADGVSGHFKDSHGNTVFAIVSTYSFIDAVRFEHSLPASTIAPGKQTEQWVWVSIGLGAGAFVIAISAVIYCVIRHRRSTISNTSAIRTREIDVDRAMWELLG